MLKISSTPINAHMDTSDYGLSYNFIVCSAVANGLTGLKTRRWRVSSISIATEYTRALSLSKSTEPEWLGQENVGAVPKKLFGNMYFFQSFVGKLTPDICPVI
jgi:hypothetical protein